MATNIESAQPQDTTALNARDSAVLVRSNPVRYVDYEAATASNEDTTSNILPDFRLKLSTDVSSEKAASPVVQQNMMVDQSASTSTTGAPAWQLALAAAAESGNPTAMSAALGLLGAAYQNNPEGAAEAGNKFLKSIGENGMTSLTGIGSTGVLYATSGLDSTKVFTNVGTDYDASETPTAYSTVLSPTENTNSDMGGPNFGVNNTSSWDDATSANTGSAPAWQPALAAAAASGNPADMSEALGLLGAAYQNNPEGAAEAGNKFLNSIGELGMTSLKGTGATGVLTATSGLDSTQTATNVGPDYLDLGGANFGVVDASSWDDAPRATVSNRAAEVIPNYELGNGSNLFSNGVNDTTTASGQNPIASAQEGNDQNGGITGGLGDSLNVFGDNEGLGEPPSEAASQATYYIVTPTGNGRYSTGTAVNIDGFLITDDHVIAKATGSTMVYDSNGNLITSAASVVRDPGTDIAVLQTNDPLPTSGLTLAPDAALSPGDPIVAVGYGNNLYGTMSTTYEGTATLPVGSMAEYDGGQLIFSSGYEAAGSSGSAGLISGTNQVVGFLKAGTNGSNAETFWTPASAAQANLDFARVVTSDPYGSGDIPDSPWDLSSSVNNGAQTAAPAPDLTNNILGDGQIHDLSAAANAIATEKAPSTAPLPDTTASAQPAATAYDSADAGASDSAGAATAAGDYTVAAEPTVYTAMPTVSSDNAVMDKLAPSTAIVPPPATATDDTGGAAGDPGADTGADTGGTSATTVGDYAVAAEPTVYTAMPTDASNNALADTMAPSTAALPPDYIDDDDDDDDDDSGDSGSNSGGGADFDSGGAVGMSGGDPALKTFHKIRKK